MPPVYIKNKKTSKPSVQAAEWNFADGNSGAIGTFLMGIFIPAFAVVNRFYVKTIVAPVGVGASISFGIPGQLQFFMVVTGIDAFIPNQCLQGVDFNANPAMTSVVRGAAPQALMSITGAPLTAGRLVIAVEYHEFDF